MFTRRLLGWGLGSAVALSLLTANVGTAHAQLYGEHTGLNVNSGPGPGPAAATVSWTWKVYNFSNVGLTASSQESVGGAFTPIGGTGSGGIFTAAPGITERPVSLSGTVSPGQSYPVKGKLYEGNLDGGGTLLDEVDGTVYGPPVEE